MDMGDDISERFLKNQQVCRRHFPLGSLHLSPDMDIGYSDRLPPKRPASNVFLTQRKVVAYTIARYSENEINYHYLGGDFMIIVNKPERLS